MQSPFFDHPEAAAQKNFMGVIIKSALDLRALL